MSPTEATEPQSWETVTPGTMGCQVGKGKEVNSGCEEMPKVPSLCGEEVGLALQWPERHSDGFETLGKDKSKPRDSSLLNTPKGTAAIAKPEKQLSKN